MRGRHKGERTLANRAVLAHQLGATGAKVVHWATHWDPPWSRWSTDAGVVVLKTRPNPITVRIESSHPLSFPGIARSSSCPQMVQWHAAQHLRHLRIEARARGSARGPGLRSRGPITRVCTVGGAAAAVGPKGTRTPAATKPGNRGDGVPAHRGTGGHNQRTHCNFPTRPLFL